MVMNPMVERKHSPLKHIQVLGVFAPQKGPVHTLVHSGLHEG